MSVCEVTPIILFDDGVSRSRRHEDWTTVVGVEVDVRQNGQVIRRGIVDDVTPDGSMIWIAGEGVSGRALFDKMSGYQIWLHPMHLQRREFTAPAE